MLLNLESIDHFGPLIRLCKVFGLIPQFDRGDVKFFPFVLTSMIYALFCIIFNVYDVFNYLIKLDRTVPLIILSKVVQLTPIFLHLLGWITKKSKHIKFINALNSWNKKAENLSYPNQYTLYGSLPFLCELLIKLKLRMGLYNAGISLFNAVQLLSLYFIAMQFCTFLEIISSSMDKITNTLTPAVAYDLIFFHNKVIKLGKTCNKLFGIQILLLVFFFSLNTVYTSFYGLEAILNNTSEGYLSGFMYLIRVFYSFFVLFSLCRICTATKMKADQFNTKLFNQMRRDRKLCRDERLLLYASMKPGINFTACGFFTLDYPLLTSILTAGIVYLVILLQLYLL